MGKVLACCVIASVHMLLLLATVQALGVVPSSQEFVFTPDKVVSYQIKVLNNDGRERQVVFYTEGELSSYISLDASAMVFEEGETEKYLTVTLEQPSSFAAQGRREGRIIAREIPQAGGQITATLTVASKLFVVVPYAGTYAESKLFVSTFEQGKQGTFVVELNNLGENDIAQAQAFIKVFNPQSGEEVASLMSGEVRVPKKTKQLINVYWTPSIPKGLYKAVATITYDGQVAEDQKVFTLGSQSIVIDSITVSDFSLGGIARFDVLLRNEWSDTIDDVYAEVEVLKGSDKYASSTTQTVDIEPLGTRLVNAYWDTQNVVPGSYDLKVSLFYQGQVTEKTFPITVRQDAIDTGFTGQVISSGVSNSSGGGNAMTILIILVVVVLITNILLFTRFMKKK